MSETTSERGAQTAPMFDAPEDASDELARGYAVYDRELGRYVTGVTKDKPTTSDAKDAAKGHKHAIVRV